MTNTNSNAKTKVPKREIDLSKVKVTHIMADGTVLDTLEGYKLDLDKVPKIVYKIVGEMLLREPKKQ